MCEKRSTGKNLVLIEAFYWQLRTGSQVFDHIQADRKYARLPGPQRDLHPKVFGKTTRGQQPPVLDRRYLKTKTSKLAAA